jgi:hypothetical protein
MASMGPMQNFGGNNQIFRQVVPKDLGSDGWRYAPIVKIEQAQTFNSPRRFSQN